MCGFQRISTELGRSNLDVRNRFRRPQFDVGPMSETEKDALLERVRELTKVATFRLLYAIDIEDVHWDAIRPHFPRRTLRQLKTNWSVLRPKTPSTGLPPTFSGGEKRDATWTKQPAAMTLPSSSSYKRT